jgi:DNA adenine methylase
LVVIKTPFTYQGSKYTELKNLKSFIPKNSKIIEPFIGTGIVSYEFGKNGSCIGNDLNSDIYYIWKYSKERNQTFLSLITEYMQEENRYEDYYYNLRDKFNKEYWKASDYSPEKSALFYYLINSCHAGLVRYGPNGFNVGFKLFLLNGRLYSIDKRVKLLLECADKFEFFYNMNSIDFLKSIEIKISNYDVVYCDPPYVNSDTMYVDSWNNDNLMELDDYLFYLNKKYNTYSVLNNYYSDDIKYKGTISTRYNKLRMARTDVTMSDNIIVTYGNYDKGSLECLFQ